MMNYEEIYRTLLKLCKNENLRLIEAELRNEKICYARMEDCVVINKKYRRFEGVPA